MKNVDDSEWVCKKGQCIYVSVRMTLELYGREIVYTATTSVEMLSEKFEAVESL